MNDDRPSIEPMRTIPAMVQFEKELRRKQILQQRRRRLLKKYAFWTAVGVGVFIANRMTQDDTTENQNSKEGA